MVDSPSGISDLRRVSGRCLLVGADGKRVHEGEVESNHSDTSCMNA